MQILHSKDFMQLMNWLYAAELRFRNRSGELSEEDKKIVENIKFESKKVTKELELTVSERMSSYISLHSYEFLHRSIESFINTFSVEIEERKYYSPLERYSSYFERPQLFGEAVFDSFPSANDDIYEAGMCLALERPTACVMHLMRVLEVGLAALANLLSVDKQNDWGKYLKEIKTELDHRAQISGARSEDEQFYSGISESFNNMRRAYRNPTMHPDRTYSQERAEEILLSIKAFMSHLPPRVFEF